MTTITRGGDAEERAHLEAGDLLFVEDFNGQPGFLGHGFGFVGENARSEFVGRLVDEVAGKILRVGNDAAPGKAFISGRALRGRKASDQDGLNVLIVLLIGLVFVGFEIGGECAFGKGLGVFFGGMALSNKESEVLDGASLQKAKSCASDLTKCRRITLLALPCSDEEQPRRLESRRRVDQSELQHFAGQFAAFGKLAQQTCRGLIDLRDTALNGVRFFKYARNQGFGIECCKRLGLQRDLHGALSPPIVVHGLFDFPASFLGAFVLAAVPRLLALRQGDFDLGDAVTEINPQRYDGQTL